MTPADSEIIALRQLIEWYIEAGVISPWTICRTIILPKQRRRAAAAQRPASGAPRW
jgi:hypothetical protein